MVLFVMTLKVKHTKDLPLNDIEQVSHYLLHGCYLNL